MTVTLDTLKQWINELAFLIEHQKDPDPKQYMRLLDDPELSFRLIDEMDAIVETDEMETLPIVYSACIFACDMCITQLQSDSEVGNIVAKKTINNLMSYLAEVIDRANHPLNFWLPILNAFYDVHIELSSDLKQAYLNAACREDTFAPEDQTLYLNSIRELINDLSDMSVFDIAENFFAQSYAMPAEFFYDLVLDLYSIEEGREIALLGLLHPKSDVRQVVREALDQVMADITLSSTSLSRLQAICHWYPQEFQDQLNRWIIQQRKKGVTFNTEKLMPVFRIRASEIDGSGSQGVFIHLKENRQNRLSGLLFKSEIGIKNAWITPNITQADVQRYYRDVFDDNVVLRDIDKSYLEMMTNHFLALTIEQGNIPDLHVLALQESLGLHFIPEKIDIEYLMQELGVAISPFTQDGMNQSLKRSANWITKKRFAYSWCIENARIDKLVNRCSHFVDGIKICRFEEAMEAILTQYMELNRDALLFHFLWNALWLRVNSRADEKVWQDSYFIAYAIQTNMPLSSIPIVREISRQTVANSIETMQDRRTYLNQEN